MIKKNVINSNIKINKINRNDQKLYIITVILIVTINVAIFMIAKMSRNSIPGGRYFSMYPDSSFIFVIGFILISIIFMIKGKNKVAYIMLIMIVLIMGVSVYYCNVLEKEKKDRIEQVGLMTDLEIEYFNEEFVKYEGDLQRKSNVKSLVLKVLSNNISNTDMQISIDGVIILNKDDTKVPEELNELDNTKKYNTKFNYGKYGNIESINIEEAKE